MITISILSLIIVVLSFTTYNLLKKNEKCEDVIKSYENYMINLSNVIETSNKKLKEVDRAGMFEKDDDVGQIFQSILKIQDILNEFNIRKTN